MPWIGGAIAAGGSLLGGLLGSDAAGDAAAAQAAAAAKAEEGINRRFDITRQDQMPFMRTGTQANARLAQLLGLGGTPGGRTTQTREQVRASLAPRFTTQGAAEPTYGTGSYESGDGWANGYRIPTGFGPSTSTVDEAGLNAAIDAEMAGGGVDSNASDYGSLLRNFSASDLEADPVYQSGLKFGLDQGTEGVNNRAAAGGMYDSGATLKALTRFANDYGSTKANESFNRYNTNNTNTYNRLAGVSGAGQTATNQVGAQGAQAANAVAGLQTDAGNARAAGIIGGANAWGDAIGGVTNAASNYFKPKATGYSAYGGYSAPPYYDYGAGGPQ